MTIFLYVALYVMVITIVALIAMRNWVVLEKVLKFVAKLGADILYELGKVLLLTGIVGIYFIPDDKDFTKAIAFGILSYLIGFATKKD